MSDADDDLNACAALVAQGDPPRFRAAMAAPVATRAALLPIYAFNVEVARAPWVSREPLIVQMRLQWWRDALDEIAAGGTIRRHQVLMPLARVLSATGVASLQTVIDAHAGDSERSRFADEAALMTYLRATGGGVMQAAAHALGQADPEPAAGYGTACALASYLIAVPALIAAGKQPLPDPRPETLSDMAQRGADWIARLRSARTAVPKRARAAYLSGWQAQGILRRAARAPDRVIAGTLAPPPVGSALSLGARALTGRW